LGGIAAVLTRAVTERGVPALEKIIEKGIEKKETSITRGEILLDLSKMKPEEKDNLLGDLEKAQQDGTEDELVEALGLIPKVADPDLNENRDLAEEKKHKGRTSVLRWLNSLPIEERRQMYSVLTKDYVSQLMRRILVKTRNVVAPDGDWTEATQLLADMNNAVTRRRSR